jgi:hypothetical protein
MRHYDDFGDLAGIRMQEFDGEPGGGSATKFGGDERSH